MTSACPASRAGSLLCLFLLPLAAGCGGKILEESSRGDSGARADSPAVVPDAPAVDVVVGPTDTGPQDTVVPPPADTGPPDVMHDTSVDVSPPPIDVSPPPKDSGFDAGHVAGCDAGHDAGFDSGFDAGHDAGFDSGFAAAHRR